MLIENSISIVEEVLGQYETVLRKAYLPYKNHVYRVIHFCLALRNCSEEEREKIVVAAAFHDIGIWTDGTVDYIPPSIFRAKEYLQKRRLEHWFDEVGLMIEMHHKIRKYVNPDFPLVEVFRKADLADVSLGMARAGLSKEQVKQVRSRFPNAGFHRRLTLIALKWFIRHPFNPVPFMKW